MRPVAAGGFLTLVAFGIGAATMVAEIAAGRLVAPFYGTSTPVWALLIGAVLASLAVGQVMGGLLSARTRSLRPLGLLLVFSGGLLLALPVVARPVMAGTLSLFRDGSLAPLMASALGVTGLLALPVVALGACGPLVLHYAVDSRESTGRIAGRIYAAGTTGSLLGTYLSGLVMIPLLGTRNTIWVGAGVLLAVGLPALLGRRLGLVAAALCVLGTMALGAVPEGPIKPRSGVIHEAETSHGFVQVTEDSRFRWLFLNDGYAFQSVLPLDGSHFLEGVWGYYALAPAFTATGRPGSALFVGLGGGTAARTWLSFWPDVEITGVELDAGVVEAGRRYMGLPEQVHVVEEDARAWLRRDQGTYAVVVVDAFQFPYVPFQLTTVEFFAALEERLAPGGVLLLNVGRGDGAAPEKGGRSGSGGHQVVDAVATTLARIFPVVRGVDVAGFPNTILVATVHRPEDDAGLAALGLPPDVARSLGRLSPPRPWRPEPGAPVLTDDRAPVEWMTDKVLFGEIARMVGAGT